MGNSNSQPDDGTSGGKGRPQLRTLNSSSTIRASSSKHHHHHHNNLPAPALDRSNSSSSQTASRDGAHPGQSKRRKSIELPDLDPSLTFSAATPQSSTHHTPTGTHPQPSWISASDWKGKSKAAPPAASRGHSFDGHHPQAADIKALPTLKPGDEVLLGSNDNDLAGRSARASSPLPISTDGHTQKIDLSSSIASSHTADLSMESDLASETEDQEYDPLQPIALPKDTDQIPPFASPQALQPLPSSIVPHSVPTSNIDPRSASSSSSALTAGAGVIPPLLPPEETVVAPAIPPAVGPVLPLGSGASASTALIVGSPFGSPALGAGPIGGDLQPVAAALAADPNNKHLLAEVTHAAALSPSAASTTLERLTSDKTPLASPNSEATGGLGLNLPASIALPPLPNPLPAAAPLVVLAGGELFNNPEAVEAVKAATVDLGAGADGVPTLLTWTPGEGEGKEGGAAEGDAAPQQVYVTGTFAKGWKTKIELHKKKSQSDFSALVNLPPGPHRLKFIVDTQWKTSKNLPSGTDQEGNLINYLQVSKNEPMAHNDSQNRFQTPEDAARYWQAEAQWTTEIPAELVAFGQAAEAEEAAMDAHDEHNRLLAQQGLPPEPMPANVSTATTLQQQVPPPSLPAQLQKGVLNQSAAYPVGSGDDNSILPKPDHTVIDHLAAAPMNKGFLSVGVTKRYRRKFVTTVLYKPVPSEMAAA